MPICGAIAALGLHVASMHSASGFNNMNPGAYVRCESGLQAGLYYNSERRLTAYGAYLHDWHMGRRFGLWGAIGAATGYQSYPVPVATAGLKYGPLRIGYIPKIGGVNETHVVTAAVEVSL